MATDEAIAEPTEEEGMILEDEDAEAETDGSTGSPADPMKSVHR